MNSNTNIKTSILRPRLRATGLMLPLLAFIAVTFIAPLAMMLVHSVYDPTVANALPETLGLLREWDGKSAPDEAVYAAAARELLKARQDRSLGRVATRVNRVHPGLRSVFTRSARNLQNVREGPYRDAMIGLNSAWGDVQTWHAIRSAGDRFTARHYLNALDLLPLPDGSIDRQPPERRIYLALLWRTFVVSLSITAILPAARLSHRPLNRAFASAHRKPAPHPRTRTLLDIAPGENDILDRTAPDPGRNQRLTRHNWADRRRRPPRHDLQHDWHSGRNDPCTPALYDPAPLLDHARHPTDPDECCRVAGCELLSGILARVLAADPARCRCRITAGIYSRHRLLHHPRAGRRQHRTTHLQHDRLPHADLAQLEPGRGTWRHPAGMRNRALSALRPHSRH